MKRSNTFKITIMSIAVVINIVGAFIATTLKLPIFIDTIGTFLSAFLFGPVGGMLTGMVTSLMAGICYKKNLFKGKFLILGIIITTVMGSIVASLISAFVFGGITSSGTSFIVMYLKEAGVNIVTSVFSTQILFDLIDKGITVLLVLTILKALPANIKVTSGV